MLSKGAAKKVTIYVNEDARHHLGPLYESILQIEALAEHLPIRIEFVEKSERIDELLPTLYDMVTDGLIEVQDTTVVKLAMKEGRAGPKRLHERKQGKAKLMRIYLGEADKWHGEPLYEAIVKQLRMMEIAGATVYRGILGYGAKGHTHKRSFMHLSRDLSVMISVIDTPEKVVEAAAAIEAMMEDGLIVVSDADIVRLLHSHSLAEVTDALGTTS